MLKLFSFLLKPFINWFKNIIINYKLRKMATNLKKAANDVEQERRNLKYKIIMEMRKWMKLDANSKYIPLDRKSKIECFEYINNTYGPEMEKLSIRITKNLKFD